MEENTIESRVFKLIEHIQPQKNLSCETRFDTLGWDSLDVMELAIETEEEFNINVSDGEISSFATVGEMVDFVTKKVNG
jgi:acyl carrier protein